MTFYLLKKVEYDMLTIHVSKITMAKTNTVNSTTKQYNYSTSGKLLVWKRLAWTGTLFRV